VHYLFRYCRRLQKSDRYEKRPMRGLELSATKRIFGILQDDPETNS